jgi:CSLREA domain-containing protein
VVRAATITVNTSTDEINTDGDCSLREAIQAANTDAAVDACTPGIGADTVVLPPGTYTLSIAGAGEDANATGDLDITDDLILAGAGAAITTIDAAQLDRVFHIAPNAGDMVVEISGVTIRNGFVNGNGGGIFNLNFASLTLNNSVVTGNSTIADNGGGIYNAASLTLNNTTVTLNSAGGGFAGGGGGILNDEQLSINSSTVSENSAPIGGGGGILNQDGGIVIVDRSTITQNVAGSDRGGGGIFLAGEGSVTVTNSTISDNTTAGGGGGIRNFGEGGPGTVTLSSNTISGNSAADGGGGVRNDLGSTILKNTIVANNVIGGDCSGTITSTGHNLIEDIAGCAIVGVVTGNITGFDPLLGPLAANGGPTQTQALLSGSPAIDVGSTDCPPPFSDQRGVARPQGSGCDIGAFESDTPVTTLTFLGLSRSWIGLINSDDQGTRFDLRVEILKNGSLVASGLTRCISGVTRNPNKALEAVVSFDPFSPVTYSSDDVLSLKIQTRIGTNPNDTKCAGHNNAVGLRMYYDSFQRQSLFAAELTPNPPADFYLHTMSALDFIDTSAPTSSTAKFKDSAAVNFAGGNPWKQIGVWNMTIP